MGYGTGWLVIVTRWSNSQNIPSSGDSSLTCHQQLSSQNPKYEMYFHYITFNPGWLRSWEQQKTKFMDYQWKIISSPKQKSSSDRAHRNGPCVACRVLRSASSTRSKTGASIRIEVWRPQDQGTNGGSVYRINRWKTGACVYIYIYLIIIIYISYIYMYVN